MRGQNKGLPAWNRDWRTLIPLVLFVLLQLSSSCYGTNIGQLLVIGVDIDPADPRAYPIEIMNHHEIVNDVINGEHIAVTWSPLTYSNVIIETTSFLNPRTVGTTGKVYQNNMVPYDRATRTYWSQMGGFALEGPLLGTNFERGQSVLTNWATWKRLYPHTRVLNRPVGSTKNYLTDPYKGYRSSDRLLYDSCFETYRTEYPFYAKEAKEITMIVFTERGNTHLFPISEVVTIQNIEDLDDEYFVLIWDKKNNFATAYNRVVNGTKLSFSDAGVSVAGEIRLPLMRDKLSNSVWNASGTCITGTLRGLQLKRLTSFATYWSAATSFFPKSQIWVDNTTLQYFPTSCPLPSSNPKCAVPCSDIIAAGPAMDAIKSIDQPIFMSPAEFEAIVRIPKKTITFYSLLVTLFIGAAVSMHGYSIYQRFCDKPVEFIPINLNTTAPAVKAPIMPQVMVLKEDDEAEPDLPPEITPAPQTPPKRKRNRNNKKHGRSTSLVDPNSGESPAQSVQMEQMPLSARRPEPRRISSFHAPQSFPMPRLSIQPWNGPATELSSTMSDSSSVVSDDSQASKIPRNKSDSALNNRDDLQNALTSKTATSYTLSVPGHAPKKTSQPTTSQTSPSLVHRNSSNTLAPPKSAFDQALATTNDYSTSFDSEGRPDSYMISLTSVHSNEEDEDIEHLMSAAALARIKGRMTKSTPKAREVFSPIAETEENPDDDQTTLDY